MNVFILTLELQFEQDVVVTRQRVRQVAALLGFATQDQIRLGTAISEIARNAVQYANGGRVQLYVEGTTQPYFSIRVVDRGPGIAHLQQILDGQYTSQTGMGLGIIGTRRLVEHFQIESVPNQGTTVILGKPLPKSALPLTGNRLGQIADELARRSPRTPLEEVRQQNRELLQALEALQQREEELHQLNRELEDTNRGVVALYAELDERAISLKRADDLKTRFLSNMSHEFRTPLNSIVSLSRMLLNRLDGDLTSEQEKQVTFIRKAAEDLSELVNDLLDLAKVEAGKIVIHPSRFEVKELFATLRGMLRPLLMHNSAIALVFDEPPEIPTLYTDEGKVAQILRNFISNSLKYTEQGEVRVSATCVSQQITFMVADTGIGIAPEDQARIFEDFVQLESPLQHQVKGTGLGLPLSQKLAELLGGGISLESNPGLGSTFSVTLPIIYPATGPTADASGQWQLDDQRIPVLVVEDQPDALFTYQQCFQNTCYQSIAAQTLDQADQALEHCAPAAVILDVMLQGQNTWAFLARLKQRTATRSLPVLVSTVLNQEQQAKVLGADAFLIKPIDRWLLLATLNMLIRRDQDQTLLLIDDDLVSRYLVKQYLHSMPLSILETGDGLEGIQLAHTKQPHAIVLDLTMPKISGFEVLEQLAQHPTTRLIPIIVNTSKVLQPEEQHYLAERTVAILSKDRSSSEIAIAQLRQALLQAGFALGQSEVSYD